MKFKDIAEQELWKQTVLIAVRSGVYQSFQAIIRQADFVIESYRERL